MAPRTLPAALQENTPVGGGMSTPSRYIMEHPTSDLTPSLSLFGTTNPTGMSEVNPFEFSFAPSQPPSSAPRPMPTMTMTASDPRKRMAMDPTTTTTDELSPPSPPSGSMVGAMGPALPAGSLPLFTPNTEKAFSAAFSAALLHTSSGEPGVSLPLPSPPSPLLGQMDGNIMTSMADLSSATSGAASIATTTMAPQDLTLSPPVTQSPSAMSPTVTSTTSSSRRKQPIRSNPKEHRIIPSKKFPPPVIQCNRPPLPTVKSSDFIVSDGVRILPRPVRSGVSQSKPAQASSLSQSSFLPSPTSSSPRKRSRSSFSSSPSPSSPSFNDAKAQSSPSPSISSDHSTELDETEQERRQRFLERNRIAASKCRQKKKAWIRDLEEKAENAQKEHDELRSKVTALHLEVSFLREQLATHHECSCSVIHEYASAKHASMPEGSSHDPNSISTGALEVTTKTIFKK